MQQTIWGGGSNRHGSYKMSARGAATCVGECNLYCRGEMAADPAHKDFQALDFNIGLHILRL